MDFSGGRAPSSPISPSTPSYPARSGGGAAAAVTGDNAERIRARVQDALGDAYRLIEMLGRGGMGIVFRARETALDREVALKVLAIDPILAPDAYAHFEREAKLAAHLDHPNIVPIYAVGQSHGIAYFAMRFVRGGTLEQMLMEHRSIPFARTIEILRDVASALDYAHQHGVIHRDIKPGNVLLSDAGHAVVSDFGIARSVGGAGGIEGTISPTNAILGSPGYMSPEQWQSGEVVAKSDQYALGVMAFQMLTGQRPFEAAQVQDLMRMHVSGPIPQARVVRPDLPAHIDVALRRAMSKTAALRFPSATAFVEALAGQRPVTITMAAIPAIPEPPPRKRESGLGIVVIVALLASLVVAGVIVMNDNTAARARGHRRSRVADTSGVGHVVPGPAPIGGSPGDTAVQVADSTPVAAAPAPRPVASPPPPVPAAVPVASDPALFASRRFPVVPDAPAFIRVVVRGGVAQVRVDGHMYGFSPVVVRVAPGTHIVTLAGAGDAFLPSQRMVDAVARDTTPAVFAARIHHSPNALDSTAAPIDTAHP